MTDTSIALIGCGAWGRNHLRNWHELGALRVVCDASAERRAEVQGQYPDLDVTGDLESVLAQPEIAGVVVATPAATHSDLALRCLEAGKDVLVEKPLALTAAEGLSLVAAAEKHQRILMVGHVLAYHPAVEKLSAMVADGTLGRLQYIYSNRLNLGKIRTEENSLWSFAPHDVALISDLLGGLPDQVACQGKAYLSQDVADVTLTTLSFGNGVHAHIFVSWLHPFKEQRFVVVCDRQMAVFDDTLPWEEKLQLYPHRVDWISGKLPVAHRAEATCVELQQTEPLRTECQHFLDCIASRSRPRTDGHYAVRVLEVLEAAQRSMEKGGAPVDTVAIAAEPTAPAAEDYQAHESATVEAGAVIGSGTRIWHYAHIMPKATIGTGCNIGQNVFVGANAVIGDGVKIQNNVSVYDGVTLEDEVFCGPSMVFTNVLNPRSAIEKKDQFRTTLVRQGATLGANCTIVCGHEIGRHAFVGAGSVVTRDVPDHAIVWGVPAHQTGWACVCGDALVIDEGRGTCDGCRRRYRLDDPGGLILVAGGAGDPV